MSPGRDRSTSRRPASPPRMLRIEFKGQPYDWFNLDEMGDFVRTRNFAGTLRENIAHYFGVPYERQAVFDDEGLLSTVVDFARALQSLRPWLWIYDIREMLPDHKEQTIQKLASIGAQLAQSQRNLQATDDPGGGDGLTGSAVHGPAGTWAEEPTPRPPRHGSPSEASTRPGMFNDGGPGGCGIGSQNYSVLSSSPSVAGRLGTSGPFMPPVFHVPPPILPGSAGNGMKVPTVPMNATGGVPLLPTGAQLLAARPPKHIMVPVEVEVQSVGSTCGRFGQQHDAWVPEYPRYGMDNSGVCRVSSMPLCDSSAREEAYSPVELVLSKDVSGGERGQRFGFANVPTRDGRALLISYVDNYGLLSMWNHVHPDLAVVEGDRIVAVNGVSEDVEAMRQLLQLDAVRMLVHRRSSAIC